MKVLERFRAAFQKILYESTPPQEEALQKRREQLAEMLAVEKGRAAQAKQTGLGSDICRHIFSLERRIAAIDDELANRAESPISLRAAVKQSWPRTIAIALLVLAIGAILVVPIWIVKYPPLLDYPNHLARAFILAHLHDPNFHFAEFYGADWGPYPYLTTDFIVIALQRLFSIYMAGRIVLSLCAVSIPLASWFLIRKANRGNVWLVGVALIASYNLFFLWGFLNYQLSTALMLAVLALWVVFLEAPSLWRWIAVLGCAAILYFTHLMGFGVAGLLVAAYTILTRQKLWQLILAGLAFAPGTILHFLFRVRSAEPWHLEFRPIAEKWERLSVVIEGYSPRLDQITIVILIGCCFAAWWRNREFRWNHPWPALTAIAFGLYWIFPSGYGFGADADIRLIPLTLLLLPMIAKVGRRGRSIAVVVLLLFCVRSANITRTFLAEQPELATLAQSFAQTTVNTRVLPVVEAKGEEPEHRPYAHFWAYGVIERGWYSPYLFTEKGVLVLEDKLDLTSPDGFWQLEYDEEPEWDDIADDYDYVWAYHVSRFAPALERIGNPVYESGDLRLYRIKKDESGEDQSP